MIIIELNMLTLFNWNTPHYYLSFVLIIIGYVKMCTRAYSSYREAKNTMSPWVIKVIPGLTTQKKTNTLKSYHFLFALIVKHCVNALPKYCEVSHKIQLFFFSFLIILQHWPQIQLKLNYFATESASCFEEEKKHIHNIFTYIG